MDVFLVLRSITYAQRGNEVLMGRRITARITRLPMELGENGCGYALRIDGNDYQRALQILSCGNVKVLRAYTRIEDGFAEMEL
jgi:hypothetical protein